MSEPIDGWTCVDMEGQKYLHVIPIQDTSVHYWRDCPCNPFREVDDDGEVAIVHQAFDGRDAIRH